ncbi:MAG: hypothetical protein V1735_02570 [Nanoarchaeota archaeon]
MKTDPQEIFPRAITAVDEIASIQVERAQKAKRENDLFDFLASTVKWSKTYFSQQSTINGLHETIDIVMPLIQRIKDRFLVHYFGKIYHKADELLAYMEEIKHEPGENIIRKHGDLDNVKKKFSHLFDELERSLRDRIHLVESEERKEAA